MKSHDIKYLGYGLGIGALTAGLALVGLLLSPLRADLFNLLAPPIPTSTPQMPSPTSTETPRPTRTFTPTPTHLPSSTPRPTATSTPTDVDMLIASGEIIISGPLTKQQQVRL